MAVEVWDEIALASPKSATLTWPAVADQHVLGLDVAVHQSGVVGGGQGAQHRLDQLQRPQRRQRGLAVDHVAQGAALDVLHHDVRPARAVDGPPWSKTETTLGWDSRAAARASRSNLRANSASSPEADVHHLDGDGPGQPGVDGRRRRWPCRRGRAAAVIW